MNLRVLVSIFVVLAVFVSSCKKDDNSSNGVYSNGIYITNEGAFGKSNGSLSFYYTSGDSVKNNVFSLVNSNRSLGDVVQSMSIYKDKGYIVVNNSNKVEVVTAADCKQIASIAVTAPRYFVGINDKGYVSTWGDGSGKGKVAVINLNTNLLEKEIEVGYGAEHMVYTNGKLYVANGGGFGKDNTISVIDVNTQTVVSTITTTGDNPTDLVVDKNNALWVICTGYVEYNSDYTVKSESAAKLLKINTSTNTVSNEFTVSTTSHPNNLEINKNKDVLYYGGGFSFTGVCKFGITDASVSTTALISKSLYGFNVNPSNDEIYGFYAPSFTANATFIRYKTDGTVIKQYEVGIGANGAAF